MSNLLNGIAGILVAVAPNYVSLLVFRTLYGFGVKGGWVAGYVLSKDNIKPRDSNKKFKKRFLPFFVFFFFFYVWNLLPSQSQSSWVWSTDAPSESFTRCSSASASSSSLCSPTTSPTGAGCRSSSPSHTSSSCLTTGEKHWLHFDFRLSNILLPERILKKQNQYLYPINGLQDS